MSREDFINMDSILKDDYDIITLYYNPWDNNLFDEDGYLYTSNPYNLISSNDLYMLRLTQEPIYILDMRAQIWYEIF